MRLTMLLLAVLLTAPAVVGVAVQPASVLDASDGGANPNGGAAPIAPSGDGGAGRDGATRAGSARGADLDDLRGELEALGVAVPPLPGEPGFDTCLPGHCEFDLVPFLVDEGGDFMDGHLIMRAGTELVLLSGANIVVSGNPIEFRGGNLQSNDTLEFRGLDVCLAGGAIAGCNGGDITGITAGFGLVGGTTAGEARLEIDPNVTQQRVQGTCSSGWSIRIIEQDGAVICERDDDTKYSDGVGLDLVGTTFNVDTGVIQRLVTGSCLGEASIQEIRSDGTVTCDDDDDTRYEAGFGLTRTGTTFDVNTSALQRRVSGACDPGKSIRLVNSDGTVDCEADDDTTYTDGNGLVLTGNAFSLLGCTTSQILKVDSLGVWGCTQDKDTTYAAGDGLSLSGNVFALIGCSDGQILKRASANWTCAADADSGGDVTAVLNGTGLLGGASSGDASLSVDAAYVQRRVAGDCAAGSSIRSIAEDGAVACEADDDTTYTHGDGLRLNGTTFAIVSCAEGQLLKRSGGAWTCAADVDSGGTVTSVTAGDGLSGGTITANGTIGIAPGGVLGSMIADGTITPAQVNTSQLQRRVTGDCAAGASIRSIAEDGSVVCEADTDTTYGPGDGLELNGTSFALVACPEGYLLKRGGNAWTCSPDADSGGDITAVLNGTGLLGGSSTGDASLSVDAAYVQRRVAADCAAGSSIRGIAEDGAVTCEADDDTTYGPGDGLNLTGTTFALIACADGEVLKRSGNAWACGTDQDSGGTVTSIAAGDGLSGGTITGSGTLAIAAGGVTSAMVADGAVGSADINASEVQRRVGGVCAVGYSIRAIDDAGAVACEADDDTTYLPGFGLLLSGTTFSANASEVQRRVAGSCAAGSSIASIAEDGTVACEADDDSGGTVTSITAGAGLSGGTISLAGTIAIAEGGVTGAMLADGTVGEAHLAFDAANQSELDGHAAGGDHDARYFTKAELQDAGTLNDAANPVDWTRLKGVPAGFADGEDDVLARPGFARTAVASGGENASLAVGVDGRAYISYYDAANADLRLLRCRNVACTSVTDTLVDAAGDVGSHNAIAIGQDGLPLISYYDHGSGALKVAHCVDADCTAANLTLLHTGGVGHDTAVAIGSDGFGVIAYRDWLNDTLRVAHCQNVACEGATTTLVDGTSTAGKEASITISPQGLPVIAYVRESVGTLRVASCTDVACEGVSIVTVSSTGSPSSPSVGVAPGGYLLVSYERADDLWVASCPLTASCSSGASWTETEVDRYTGPGGSGNGIGYYTSIAIGADALPVVSYYDAANDDLKVAHCSTASCSAATNVTVESTGDVGAWTTMGVGGDGYPIIAYQDGTNGGVRVAHCSNPYCVPFHRGR